VSGHANGVAIIVPDEVQSIFAELGGSSDGISSQFAYKGDQSAISSAAIVLKTAIKSASRLCTTIWGQSGEKTRDRLLMQQYTVIFEN
jgi:hypothetical protein